MNVRRTSALAAVTLALTFAAVGCGSDSDDDSDTATDTSSSTGAPEDEPTDEPSEESTSLATGAPSGEPTEGAEAPGELPDWAPAVETDGDGAVTGLDFTGTPEPTDELLVTTITEGDGPPVESGQTITANYFGSVYQGEQPFDESFSSSPFQAPIGVGSLIPGWDQTIPGIPVGSRILMSIPAELAYGDADQPGIPGGSTLYFVIDIIDAA